MLGGDRWEKRFNVHTRALLAIKYKEIEKIPTVLQAKEEIGSSINSVVATSDGGYLAGGSFANSLVIGNKQLTSIGGSDGLLIKYDKNEKVQWVSSIGGTEDEVITSITETNDGGVAVAGNFKSDTISVGEESYKLDYQGFEDGIIIRYDKNGDNHYDTISAFIKPLSKSVCIFPAA